MAWDLWESSYDQDMVESSNNLQSEWHCDFSFGYECDIIEENALNEKSCIQVLRIQIVKAEMEIDDLEQNLASLQTQLSFVEDEKCSELFCKALNEKINDLDISVRRLKNMSRTLTELQLSIHWEPAEEFKDILKALLRKFFQEKEKESLQLVTVDANSNTLVNSTELSETIVPRNLVSDIIIKEESGERNAPEERCEEKKMDCPEEIKVNDEQPAHVNSEDSIPECMRIENGSSDEKMEVDPVEEEPNSKDEIMSEHESPRHEVKRSVEVAQNEELTTEASCSRSFTFSNESFSDVKSLCKADTKTNKNLEVGVGVRKEYPTSTDNVHCEKDQARDKASNAIVEYTSIETFIRSVVANARNTRSKSNFGISRPKYGSKRPEKEKKPLEQFESKVEVGKPEAKSPKIIDASQNLCLTLIQLPQKNPTAKDNFDRRPFVAFDRSHLNAELAPQTERAKRKPEQDPQNLGRNFPPPKTIYDALPISANKRRKDDFDELNSSLKQLYGKIPKKSTPLESSGKDIPKLLLGQNTKDLNVGVKSPDRSRPNTIYGQIPKKSTPLESSGKDIPKLLLGQNTKELTVDVKFLERPRPNATYGKITKKSTPLESSGRGMLLGQNTKELTTDVKFPDRPRANVVYSKIPKKSTPLESSGNDIPKLLLGQNTKELTAGVKFPDRPRANAVYGKIPKKSTPLESSGKDIPELRLLGQSTKESTVDVKFSDRPQANAITNCGPLVNNPDFDRLNGLKVPELKAIAKNHNLTCYSKMKKTELIQFLVDKLGSRVLT